MADSSRKDGDKLYSAVSRSENEAEDLALPSPREPKGEGCCGSVKRMGKTPIFLVCFLMIIIIVVIVVLALYLGKKTNPPVVYTDCFVVQGEVSEGVYVFKGIPYAEPPVGDLRWRPPVAIENGTETCDKSTYEATKFSDMCYQPSWLNKSVHSGSEDCLYLNVWTPSLSLTAKLPVMVWIHGGYLLILDGNYESYSPNEEVTRDMNMVFVSMNYRLNAFGFMALDLLSQETANKTSGNYGFRDQILALEWVKRNIAAFGGDPDKVTIFGQSSGGTSVAALLASPKAKGLFHAAWVQSGSPILNKTLAEAVVINEKFLGKTRCSNTTCLRALSPREVLNAVPWVEYPTWGMEDLFDLPIKGEFDGPLAIVDGDVIPEAPMKAWNEGTQKINSPVIIGVTAQEVDLLPVQLHLKTWNSSQYEAYVKSKLDTFGGDISRRALELYPYRNGSSPEYLLTTMTSDVRVVCATSTFAKAMANAAGGQGVYNYVVTARPSAVVPYFGFPFSPEYSFHCIDSFAFFGTLKDFYQPLAESDKAFQSVLRKEILNFANTGRVSTEAWKTFPTSTALLAENITIIPKYQPERCDFWLKNGFFSYSWVN